LTLSLEQGACLVSIARKAIDTVVGEERVIEEGELPAWSGGSDEFLKTRRGAFVTLSKLDGELRGCIGIPYPLKPLWEAVVHAAVGAARHDPRFPRVEAWELDSLTVEVSALTEPEAIETKPPEFPSRVRIGSDGLIVTGQGTSGLLLPQVATEMGLTAETFLSLTCEKAGLPPDAWFTGKVKVLRFQAEVFVEATPRGTVGELRAQM
jgi:uncharacterized protein (TIGR00296 family)